MASVEDVVASSMFYPDLVGLVIMTTLNFELEVVALKLTR